MLYFHHFLFAQSTSNSHIQQCNIVEQDSKVQERTLTAARKRSMYVLHTFFMNNKSFQLVWSTNFLHTAVFRKILWAVWSGWLFNGPASIACQSKLCIIIVVWTLYIPSSMMSPSVRFWRWLWLRVGVFISLHDLFPCPPSTSGVTCAQCAPQCRRPCLWNKSSGATWTQRQRTSHSVAQLNSVPTSTAYRAFTDSII